MQAFLLLFYFYAFIGLFVWLFVLNSKVDKLSTTIRNLTKNVDILKKYISDFEVEKLKSHSADNNSVAEERCTSRVNENEEQKIYSVPTCNDVSPSEPAIPHPQPKYVHNYKQKEDFDIQRAFLGNIFNKIGALAIIIALIIFIKLISPFFVLTPFMKVVLGYIVSIGLTGSGLILHHADKFKNYSESLLGAGFAGLFINTFCAYSYFHLFNMPSTIVVGGLILVLTYLISDRMKTVSMLVIGLIGGYLTPFFSGADANITFSYLIFLNMISLVYTLRNKNFGSVNVINLIFTMLIFAGFQLFSPPVNVVFPIVLWALYLGYDFFADKTKEINKYISGLNYLILTLFSILLFRDAHLYIGCLMGFTALVYAVSAVVSRFLKSDSYKIYEYSVLINVWFVVYFLLHSYQQVIGWSVIALLLTPLVIKYNFSYLKRGLGWYFISSFIVALVSKYSGDYCLTTSYAPIINIRTLVFGVPAISMLASGFMFRNYDKKYFDLSCFGALSLCGLYCIGEINSIMSKTITNMEYRNFNSFMLCIIVGLTYSLVAKKLYLTSNNQLFNIFSCLINIISLVSLCLSSSYIYIDGIMPFINLRCVAYIYAILACILYAKWSKFVFYKYLAVFLGFILCHSEAAWIAKINDSYKYIISLFWVLYSGAVTICGILCNKKYLINSGIVIIILSILRIFVYDLAKVDAIYKLVAFLVLGIILMLVSYIYTSKKKQ